MYNTLVDICFPGVLVVSLYRSFMAPFLVHRKLPNTVRNMLTCPLCLGFHVTWAWLLVRCMALRFDATLGENIQLIQVATIPFFGGLFSYCLEHVVSVITVVERILANPEIQINVEAVHAQTESTSTSESVEERRRG